MKAKQYHKLRVPIQKDVHNCGVYVLHYATYKTCHAPYDVNFNPEKFRRRLLIFTLGLCWYLSSESDKFNDEVSIMEWLMEKHPDMKPLNYSKPPKQSLCHEYYNPSTFNQNILPFDAFERYLRI